MELFWQNKGFSSLLFMLKSNKNPGSLLNGSRTPTGGPRGTRFPLDIPSPRAHSGSIKCLSGMACRPSFRQAVLNFSESFHSVAQKFAGAPAPLFAPKPLFFPLFHAIVNRSMSLFYRAFGGINLWILK